MSVRALYQRGVAAIEFAMVLLVLLLALYGMATFGAVLYTQQALVRAAADGARALQSHPSLGVADIRNVVWDSLSESLVTPHQPANPVERRSWIATNVSVEVSAPTTSATVTVTYPYRTNRLLPSLPMLDASRWMPDNLMSRATTAL